VVDGPLTPEDILEIQMVAEPQVSADGTLVAFTVTAQDAEANQARSSIWVAATDGSAPPRRLTQGPARDQRPRFSPDGKHLAFLSNREREWRHDLHVLDLAGGESTRVARLPRGILDFDWSPDGRRLALLGRPDWPSDPDMPPAKDDEEARKRYQERTRHLVNRFRYRMDGLGQLDDEEPQIWVVNVSGENKDLRQITHGPWPASRPRWTPDGRVAYLANHSEDWWRSELIDVWAVDPDGGEPQRLTPGTATVTTFAFAPDGKMAYVAIGPGPGSLFARNHHLFIGDEDRTAGLDRSVWANVNTDMTLPRDVPDLCWTRDSTALYTPITDRGRIAIARTEAAGGPPQATVDGDRVIPAFSLGGSRLAFLSTSFDDPLTLRVANSDGTDERVLFEPNPWLRGRALGRVNAMPFEHEGRTIDAWVLLPPGYGGGRVPTILDIHGGPHAAWGWSFSHVMQTMAGQGHAVVFCNSPGSQTYDQDFSVGLTGRWGELDFPVWMAAVDRAIADGVADPERLGVTGASYGGFSTLWVIGHTDRFRAALSMRPVSELQAFYGSSDIGWNFGEHSFAAEPWQDPELFRRLSPVTYIEKMKTPLRIIASSGDLRTPLEQAEQIYVRLLKLGREVELTIFHGEPHALTTVGKPWNRVRQMRSVLEWWGRSLGRTPAQGADGANSHTATVKVVGVKS
jgi:dipeptidyl aminopeptidase/acylaminoacyl peptidase